GRPGAAFADLAMQFFGFAVAAVVFPLGLWGWNLFRLYRPRRPVRQALAWIGGILTFAAALACLPTMAAWPLPTGLGGAVGDIILAAIACLDRGAPSLGLYAALCVVLGGLSVGLIWGSCLRRPISARPAPARRRRPVVVEDDEDSENKAA